MKLIVIYTIILQIIFFSLNADSTVSVEVTKIEPSEISSVIENQLKALRSKDVNAAYNNFTTKKFRNTTPFEDYQKIVQSNKSLSGNKLFRYDSFYVENGVASFSGELVATDGSFTKVEFDVIKEDSSWKINGMQLFQFEQTVFPR